MKYNEKIEFKPDQLEYDLRMKKRHNWWWLLLLLLIPLILWLLSRCDGIVVTPPEDFNDTIDIPVDPKILTTQSIYPSTLLYSITRYR